MRWRAAVRSVVKSSSFLDRVVVVSCRNESPCGDRSQGDGFWSWRSEGDGQEDPRPEHQSGLRRSVNSAVYVERWCVLVSKLREIVGLDSLAEGALLAFSQWEVQRSRLPLESFPSSLYLLSAAAARGVNVRRYMEFVLYDMYFPRRCSS